MSEQMYYDGSMHSHLETVDVYEDVNGNPMVDSAGEPFDPPAQIQSLVLVKKYGGTP